MIQKTPKEEKKPLAHDHIDLKPDQGQHQDGEHHFNINSNIYCTISTELKNGSIDKSMRILK